jgi:O-antigen/teichoic acid export membrane protein
MFTTLPVACINRLNSTGTHGARFVSLTAMSGLILAVILWFPLSHLLGLKGVALGYLIATFVTATVSIVRCWRLDDQEWSVLFTKAFVAFAVIVAGLILTTVASLPDIAGVGLAFGFTAIWGFMCRRDVQRIRSARTSPKSAAAAPGPAQPDRRPDEQDDTTANS